MLYKIYCEECDSEYKIEIEDDLYIDEPSYCCICNSKIIPEKIIESE